MLLKGKTILITEDYPLNRVTFQITLSLQGASVVFERFGQGTVEKAKFLSKIDLIVLDLMLANGVDGYQVFQEIRKVSQFDDVPIVAVSASDPTQAMEKCKALGFNGFIPKPIDERLFPGQLLRIMEGEQIWLA